MIRVSVGQKTVELGELDEQWLHREIRDQRAFGTVCVRIEIRQGSVALNFATHGCGRGGSTREYNRQEQGIIQRWLDLGLADIDWNSGQVVAFLKSLRNL